jgi:flagellar assembly protein FliH
MILSKILSASEADVRPINWRSRAFAPSHTESGPAAAPVVTRDVDAEIQQQARLAFEAGLHEGEAAALQKVESEVRQLTSQLAQAAVDVASSRSEAIRNAEADIVRLSVEIAQRIIHRELSLDTSALGSLIRAALEKLASQEVHRVRVHPDQAETVRACLEQIGRSANIEVVSDPTQPPGGAIFETSRGSLDASLETQLREIERGLTNQLQERT